MARARARQDSEQRPEWTFLDDPAKTQADMESAALGFIAEAERALAGLVRKDDPDTYDRKRADLQSARVGYRALRTFGPGAL